MSINLSAMGPGFFILFLYEVFMSFETVRRDITTRFATNWATTGIAWQNQKFTPPDGTAWVRFSVLEGDTGRINIGNPGHHRHVGMITVQIFVPHGTGTKTAREYAATIATIFRDQQFNGITCREASLAQVGEVENWYQMNLTIPFYWDGAYSV